MKKSIFKLNRSLGKYTAIRVADVTKDDDYAEIFDVGMDQYNNGKFEATIYTKGVPKDIEMGGWCFSYFFRGRYHMPGSYESVSFEIHGVDCNGEEVVLLNTPFYQYFSMPDVLCSYLNLITLYSNFENAGQAQNFNSLLRYVEEKKWIKRSGDDITNDTGLNLLKDFRAFYRSVANSDKDKHFMKFIKDSVNSAIDKLIMSISENRIE